MKWEESAAAKCRYARVTDEIFKDADVIWEESVDDCQGHANFLLHMPDGTFVHYSYTYGSCSVCDEWEDRCLTDDEIAQVIRNEMATLANESILRRYLHLDPEPPLTPPDFECGPGEHEDHANIVPLVNRGWSENFDAMAQTASGWLVERALTRGDQS